MYRTDPSLCGHLLLLRRHRKTHLPQDRECKRYHEELHRRLPISIDGVTTGCCHGEWLYASWGINRDPNAALTLDFRRDVTIDRIVIYLRADFPHDNWWKSALLTFSDGRDMELNFSKTGAAQEFTFEPKTIRKPEFSHLIKAETESPFPNLVNFSSASFTICRYYTG